LKTSSRQFPAGARREPFRQEFQRLHLQPKSECRIGTPTGNGPQFNDELDQHPIPFSTLKDSSLRMLRQFLATISAQTDIAFVDMAPRAPGRTEFEKISAVVGYTTEIINLLMASAGAGVDLLPWTSSTFHQL
jgi:hypothetical protein